MEDLGAFEFLTMDILKEKESGSLSEECDEALIIFHHRQCTDIQLRKTVQLEDESIFFDALLRIRRIGRIESRLHALMLLRKLFKVVDPAQITGIKDELFEETVRILKDNGVSLQTIKASLELVTEIIRWGRNRIKAAESGMVSVLIELLIDNSDRRVCELMLVALEQICRCAEGRAKFLEHAAGLATVSKKVLMVSHVASDRAVRILFLICRFSSSYRVLQEMLEVGVVSKLCLVIQVDCSETTKERVKQILNLNSRIWKEASCIPAHLLSSYPSL